VVNGVTAISPAIMARMIMPTEAGRTRPTIKCGDNGSLVADPPVEAGQR
jgi:hypothetical protein